MGVVSGVSGDRNLDRRASAGKAGDHPGEHLGRPIEFPALIPEDSDRADCGGAPVPVQPGERQARGKYEAFRPDGFDRVGHEPVVRSCREPAQGAQEIIAVERRVEGNAVGGQGRHVVDLAEPGVQFRPPDAGVGELVLVHIEDNRGASEGSARERNERWEVEHVRRDDEVNWARARWRVSGKGFSKLLGAHSHPFPPRLTGEGQGKNLVTAVTPKPIEQHPMASAVEGFDEEDAHRSLRRTDRFRCGGRRGPKRA